MLQSCRVIVKLRLAATHTATLNFTHSHTVTSHLSLTLAATLTITLTTTLIANTQKYSRPEALCSQEHR